MNQRVTKRADAYKVEIFIGVPDMGLETAREICEAYCTRVGLCVTIQPLWYVYRGGHCDGIVVGLINYARFPSTDLEIWDKAILLANELKEGLDQGSFTVQDHQESLFVSTRDEDQPRN